MLAQQYLRQRTFSCNLRQIDFGAIQQFITTWATSKIIR